MKPFKYTILSLLLSLCALPWAGCMGDWSGIAPPDDEFNYPVALATIKNDKYLLVVNSNNLLEFNAGTVVAYDLNYLNYVNGNPAFPLSYDSEKGMYTLPAGKTLAQYCTGGIAAGIVCNLSVSAGIRSEETIHIGAFATSLHVNEAGDLALIPTRSENAIIKVDLLSDDKNIMDCGESTNPDRRCDLAHRIESNSKFTLPMEPKKVATLNYSYIETRKDAEGNEEEIEIVQELGFATHQYGGEVTLFSLGEFENGVRTSSDNQLHGIINGLVEGASGLVAKPETHEIFVVGERAPQVSILKLYTDLADGGSLKNDPLFGQDRTIDMSEEIRYALGARDITVSPDGKTGYVVIQQPPTLVKLDLKRYEVIDSVPICDEASRVETYVDERDPAQPLDDKLYAFITCFETKKMYVVDTQFMIANTRVTGEGPQDIAFDNTRKIAYIANYSDFTVTMIQAVAPHNLIRVKAAGTSDYESLVLRIGKPELSKGL